MPNKPSQPTQNTHFVRVSAGCLGRYASMKNKALAGIIILLSGCTNVVSKNQVDLFKGLLGEKTLTTDGLICRKDRKKGAPTANQIVWQDENNKCYIGDTVLNLSAGDKVFITEVLEVKRLNLFKFQNWYLVGYTTISGVKTEFIYLWALTTASPEYPEIQNEPKWN